MRKSRDDRYTKKWGKPTERGEGKYGKITQPKKVLKIKKLYYFLTILLCGLLKIAETE